MSNYAASSSHRHHDDPPPPAVPRAPLPDDQNGGPGPPPHRIVADFPAVAAQFCHHYYGLFDHDRESISLLYTEDSMLTLNGVQIVGAAAIGKKLQELGGGGALTIPMAAGSGGVLGTGAAGETSSPPVKFKHSLKTVDPQPSPDNSLLSPLVTEKLHARLYVIMSRVDREGGGFVGVITMGRGREGGRTRRGGGGGRWEEEVEVGTAPPLVLYYIKSWNSWSTATTTRGVGQKLAP